MKRFSLLLISTALLAALVLFQNCGSYHLEGTGASIDGKGETVDPLVFAKKVWTKNRLHIDNKAVILYVNPEVFATGSQFDWYYELDGANTGCTSVTVESFSNAVQLTCTQPGELEVTLSIISPDFAIEELQYSVAIDQKPESMPTDEEIYFSDEELVVKMDGSFETGGGGEETPTTQSGTELYASYCGNCHRAQASISTKRGRSLYQLKEAIKTENLMLGLSSLSDAQLQKIIDALAN